MDQYLSWGGELETPKEEVGCNSNAQTGCRVCSKQAILTCCHFLVGNLAT